MLNIELKHLLSKIAAKRLDPMETGPWIMSKIPEIQQPTTAVLSIQSHHAKKAGYHQDLRISLPGTEAFSWALPKGLPKPGEKHLAIRTFDHPVEYQKFEGELGPGYGEGKVILDKYTAVEILESSPDKIKFAVYDKSDPEEYTLIHTHDDKWLILNSTPTRDKIRIPAEKTKITELNLYDEKLQHKVKRLLHDDWVFTPKFDGIHSFVVIEPDKQIRVFSRVVPKNKETRLIEYTHKIPGLLGTKAPSDVPPTILRTEIFGVQGEQMVPVSTIVSALHSNAWKSRYKLEENNIKVFFYPFDIHKYQGREVEQQELYQNKLELMKQISKKLPQPFLEPIVISDRNEKEQLLSKILNNEPYPYLDEGLVAWKLDEPVKAIKIKRKNVWDVYIQDVKPGSGRRSDEAGAIGYSLEPNGPIVGWVNTAPLPEEMRKELIRNPEKFKNVALRVSGLKLGTDKAIRHPVIESFHEEKTLEQGKLKNILPYIEKNKI